MKQTVSGTIAPKYSHGGQRFQLTLIDDNNSQLTIAKNAHWFRLCQLIWEEVVLSGEFKTLNSGRKVFSPSSVKVVSDWPVEEIEQDDYSDFSASDYKEIAVFLEPKDNDDARFYEAA